MKNQLFGSPYAVMLKKQVVPQKTLHHTLGLWATYTVDIYNRLCPCQAYTESALKRTNIRFGQKIYFYIMIKTSNKDINVYHIN